MLEAHAVRLAPTRRWSCLLVGVVLLVGGCTPHQAAGPAPVTSSASSSVQARAYLTSALDLLQQNALVRDRIDWARLRAEAMRQARQARSTADTYPAIRWAVAQLGDGHSSFMDPREVGANQRAATLAPLPTGQRLAGGVGHLVLPAGGGQGARAGQYAVTGGRIIQQLDRIGVCGWVVDLRDNTGGNMWPMLAAVGPVLGEGRAGGFADPDGNRQGWSWRDGQALLDREVLARGVDYRLLQPASPVAVLTNRSTASSGEAIVVAFRGRPHTRSFGAPTYGLPTGNETMRLSDGAMLVLTTVWFVDRTNARYEGRISPDQFVNERTRSRGDPVLTAATRWLRTQPGCP